MCVIQDSLGQVTTRNAGGKRVNAGNMNVELTSFARLPSYYTIRSFGVHRAIITTVIDSGRCNPTCISIENGHFKVHLLCMRTVAWYGFVSPFDHHPHTMQAGPATNGTLRARAAPTMITGAELVEDGHHAYVETGNICINIAILYTCV